MPIDTRDIEGVVDVDVSNEVADPADGSAEDAVSYSMSLCQMKFALRLSTARQYCSDHEVARNVCKFKFGNGVGKEEPKKVGCAVRLIASLPRAVPNAIRPSAKAFEQNNFSSSLISYRLVLCTGSLHFHKFASNLMLIRLWRCKVALHWIQRQNAGATSSAAWLSAKKEIPLYVYFPRPIN